MIRLDLPPDSAALFPGEGEGLVLLHAGTDEAADVFARLPQPRPTLAAIAGIDWNRDLSPSPAPAVFGDAAFAGGADRYLAVLTGRLMPAIEATLPVPPAWRGIAGYSLAGLFALYAATQTDRFSRAASVSGSLWFDGFADALPAAPHWPALAYLSLSDREKLTRNPRMAAVEACTDRTAAILRAAGVTVVRETNPGGHFRDVTARLARGIAALYKEPV